MYPWIHRQLYESQDTVCQEIGIFVSKAEETIDISKVIMTYCKVEYKVYLYHLKKKQPGAPQERQPQIALPSCNA
jgi:hypothetical protein